MQIKIDILPSLRTRTLVWLGLALAAGFVPAIIHTQWLTGPLVNSILILTAALVGPWAAIAVGVVPSGMALAAGLLPAALATTIPFIVIGNALFVAGFWTFRKNPLLGVGIGAAVKFIFLAASSQWILNLLLADPFAQKVAIMLSWPQLYTALIGGVIALGILKIARKK